VVVAGEGRDTFADALEAGLAEARGPDQPGSVVAKMRGKAFAAPCAVMLVASPDPTSNVPVWEQVASASCTGYAIVLAATSLGYGAVWKSAAVLDTGPVRALFGAGPDERLLGWVNLGTPGAGEPGRRDGVGDPGDLVSVVGSLPGRN
jgi:nitroreductase